MLPGHHRSSKLWSFYADLEESLGTLESACGVYDKMLELKVATPQIILNYALMLQVGRAGWQEGWQGGVECWEEEQQPQQSLSTTRCGVRMGRAV